MKILAVHDGHNASACLLSDGYITHFSQEERFTYVKNAGGLPTRVIAHIAEKCGSDFDEVVFSSQHMGTVDWSREAHIREMFVRASMRKSIRERLKRIPPIYELYRGRRRAARLANIESTLGRREIQFLDHHFCHASS